MTLFGVAAEPKMIHSKSDRSMFSTLVVSIVSIARMIVFQVLCHS